MKILIIEDDEDGRENLADILGLDEHTVCGVPSGSAALEQCNQNDFDTMILDWKLPDLNANDLIPRLQELQPDKPIIVVTGYGDVELIVSAMRSGVYDYLEKPINPSVLRATLARVAERQENLERLESVQEQLVESERLAAIGQMVAGLAHESRNAFQRSQACLEMLELNLADEEENLQIISKIQKALEELQKLYEEVRGYAAPIVLANDKVNIVSLIQETWRQIQSIAPNPQVELKVDVEGDLASRNFVLDLHRFHQVLRNLLENALDAVASTSRTEAPPEGQKTITARLFVEAKKLRIEVVDEGPGIPPEKRENIFEPFFTTKTRGTGLGLAIARRVIEKHGGSLTLLDSDSGARFQISLPMATAEVKA